MQQLQERVHLVAVVGGTRRVARGDDEQRVAATRAGSGARTRASKGSGGGSTGGSRSIARERVRATSPCSGQPATKLHWPQSGPLTARGCAIACAHHGRRARRTIRAARRCRSRRARLSRRSPRTRSVQTTRSGSVPTQRESRSTASRIDSRSVGSAGVRPHQRSNCRSSFLPASSTTVRSIHPPIRSPRRGESVGGVEAVVVEHHRTVAEQLDVPPCRLREHRLLLGLQRVADPGEVGDHRRAELGVDVAHGLEEHLSQPRPVHRVVGAGAAVDLLGQTPRAHGVGAAQQVGRDLGQRVRLHRAEATALGSREAGFPRGPGAVGTHS